MPAILQQLRTRVDGFPATLTDRSNTVWTFDHEIKKKENAFFSSLVIKNPLLFTQYRIQCSHVIHLFNDNLQHTEALLRAVETALVMAELLEQVYCRLDEKSNLEQLHHEQAIFRELLSVRYPQFRSTLSSFANSKLNIDQKIRTLTSHTNFPRQAFNRIWRMIDNAILLDELVILREWIEPIELMADPVFIHLNWIFFVPRLAVNLMLLGKHVISNPWMSEQEYVLPWYTRLHVHLMIHRRWIELINDFVWCLGNLISCFLCVGVWSFAEVYFAVGLQLFDLLFTCVHVAIEISRLNTLEKEYQDGCANGVISIDQDYFQALQQRIAYEKKMGYLAIINHTLLLISIMTILPFSIALNPWAPVLGAMLSIFTTIGLYFAEDHLKKQHMHDDIPSLAQHRFFKPLSEPERLGSELLTQLNGHF